MKLKKSFPTLLLGLSTCIEVLILFGSPVMCSSLIVDDSLKNPFCVCVTVEEKDVSMYDLTSVGSCAQFHFWSQGYKFLPQLPYACGSMIPFCRVTMDIVFAIIL